MATFQESLIQSPAVLAGFFHRQKPSVKSALGLGKDYDTNRWNRELKQDYVKAGMKPAHAEALSNSVNDMIRHSLQAGEPLDAIHAYLLEGELEMVSRITDTEADAAASS